MESTLAFLDGDGETSLQSGQVTIVWEFKVIDTGHHAGEIVIRCVWVFAWAAHDGEDGSETLESCFEVWLMRLNCKWEGAK